MNRNLKKNTIIYDMPDSSISYYMLARNYSCSYKTHSRLKLIFVLSGEVCFAFEDNLVEQNNTGFLLLPYYSAVDIQITKPTKLMIIDIDDCLVKSVFRKIDKKPHFSNAVKNPLPFVLIRYTNIIFRNVQNINSDYKDNIKDPYIVELGIKKLIYNLLKTEHAGYLFSIRARHPMEQAVYYIERNINKTIRINDIAESLNMSGPNFTNTFKRHYGVSPHTYIRNYKMKLAKERLRENTVTDTAFDLGYENVSAFISHFKKVNNTTPKQYQITRYYDET